MVGLYGKCGSSYLSCTQIELKPDSTFEYFIFMDVGGTTIIKGNWEAVSKDSIRLNTFEQPKHPITTYKGQTNPKRPNIKIKVSCSESPLAGAYVLLNDQSEGIVLEQNGVGEFKAQKVKTITYSFLGQKETIFVENPDYNEIEIMVRDLDLNAVPRFLTEKIIFINKKKLFLNRSYSLKKTSLKNKQWK
jgi:hypothetical protein